MMLYGLIIQFVTALFPSENKRFPLFALGSFLASCLLAWGYSRVLFLDLPLAYTLELGAGLGSADIVIDKLAAFFGLIFALGFPLGALYGHYYLRSHQTKGISSHNLFLALMIISMHLVLVLRNGLLFLTAWEVMSLASFFAIMSDRENEETISSALYYFVMMHIGAAVLMIGFGLMYLESGSFNFGAAAISGLVKWLLIIGFAFKAGFFPFYSWLPKAHPVAPAHLSGLMSGLMIKTGIFGILIVINLSQWQAVELYLLLLISLVTAFNGVIHALAENNIKRALAYSSIENIGIIGIGICLWLLGRHFGSPLMATMGIIGALMHTLNHSLFKPLLFYLSGNILAQTHTLNPDLLGGLNKKMPRTALLFLLGTAAISALPVLNGFISEFAIFAAALSGFQMGSLALTITSVAAGAGFAFVSALALIAFTKIYSIALCGAARSEAATHARETGFGMLASPLILALICVVLGVFGNLGLYVVQVLASTFGMDIWVIDSYASVLSGISIVLSILIVLSSIIYFSKRQLTKLGKAPTWGCGYQKPQARMQYSGSAFINPLAYFLKPLVHKQEIKYRADGYFPRKISYEEEVRDYVDKGLVNTCSRWITRFFSLFDGIHNGRSNSYISYLLIALLAMLIWVLGVSK
jgi:formate hydrogenlyase subunit 3/multisubunit Na+/H+ antiporter MnhD subunit